MELAEQRASVPEELRRLMGGGSYGNGNGNRGGYAQPVGVPPQGARA
jgi:hypothetical protein